VRLLSLARIAAEAEGVRLKALGKRQAMRGVFAAVASVFALLMLVMLEIAGFAFLEPLVGGGFAALIVAGVDLVLLAIFAALALRNTPGHAEREAARISRQARTQITDTLATYTLVAPAARAVAGSGMRGAVLSAIASQWFAGRRRKKKT
jgi:fatty acid desaturase